MKVLFAGTPDIAVPTLRQIAAVHRVVGVLTAPDRKGGRGNRLLPPAVKLEANELAVPVLQPDRLGSEARSAIADLGDPEILVCVAYGKIFGPKFLAMFPRGGLNLHPSLLPKYRGPSPLPAAILAGDSQTGVSIQYLAAEMDSGDILAQERLPIGERDTTESLSARAAQLGARLMLEVVNAVESGRVEPRAQRHDEATYTRIIEKADGEIDWSQPAERIARAVRAYIPWPLAHTSLNGAVLNILEAEPIEMPPGDEHRNRPPGYVIGVDKRKGILIKTGVGGEEGGAGEAGGGADRSAVVRRPNGGTGAIAVQRLQLQAKKPLDWKSFMNGMQDFPGTVLGG